MIPFLALLAIVGSAVAEDGSEQDRRRSSLGLSTRRQHRGSRSSKPTRGRRQKLWSKGQIYDFVDAYQTHLYETLSPYLTGEVTAAEYEARIKWVIMVKLPEVTKAWAADRQVQFLGAGFFRAVFAIPNGALKVATMRGEGAGVRSNRNEILVDATAPDSIRALLVPLLDSDPNGNWVLMERVEQPTAPDPDRARQIWEVLGPCGIIDVQPKNLSADGRLLDYGEVKDERKWRKCAASVVSRLPSPDELEPYVALGECTECAAALVRDLPEYRLTWQAGGYLKGGRYRDHAWVSAPDGTIVDTTHGQFDPAVPVLVARPGTPEHDRYLRAEDMTDEQRLAVYGPP